MRISTLLFTGLLCAMESLHAAAEKKMNVLFIAVDDLRPELGCYGNAVVKTPNIDRLAKRGLVFTRAYCQQAVCSPSRASLMTGKRPDATRVWDLDTHFRVALPKAATVGQFFKNNGYFSQGMGKIFHGGFDDPETWSVPLGTPKAEVYANAKNNDSRKESGNKGPAFEAGDVADDFYTDGKTARLAVEALSELKKKDKPFFLAVGFSKPHLPFVAPKKYWDLYDPDQIPDTRTKFPEGTPSYVGDNDSGELRAYTNIPSKEAKGAFTPMPDPLARDLRHGYYAAISYTDACLGLVLDALEAQGLADRTVIVLWGDHGWKLGEHEEWGKHTNFEVDTRVPLIFSVPGMQQAGKASASLVEFVDVYPTLADVCGLPKPDTDGVSLKPVLEDPLVRVKPVAISQYPKTAGIAAGVKKASAGKGEGRRDVMGYSIRDERWRLTLWRGIKDNRIYATELYDEVSAPGEPANLAGRPENQEVVERLSKFLPPPIPEADPNAVKIPKSKKNLVDVEARKKDEDATAPGVTAKPEEAPKGQQPLEDKDKERLELFEKRDVNHDGKLTREEFLAHSKDPEKAAANFLKWDTDKSGDLSREEFLKMGK